MLNRLYLRPSVLGFLMIATVCFCGADASGIAVVDFADQWNKLACVGTLLDDLGRDYKDLSQDVENGNLDLTSYGMLIIGSFVTNNAKLHASLDDNAAVIRDFVDGGGTVIELTQADQNQANVDWLPQPLTAVRSDLDYATIVILESDHIFFNKPNKLTEGDLSNWKISSGAWSTGWETFVTQSGFTVLAAQNKNAANPCFMEAQYGNGKFVLLSIALDKKHVLGTTDASKQNSMLLMENILAGSSLAVEPADKLTASWGAVKRSN